MKRLILHILALAPVLCFGQTISDFGKTITDLTAGGLSAALADEQSPRVLRVKGQMNAADFSYLQDHCSDLQSLDLSGVTIVAYNGDALPYTGLSTSPAATLPPYSLTGLAKLMTVKLPANLKAIGKGALSGTGITSVQIPASCTEIDDYAFMRCESLRTVELPATVEEIGERAFAYCTALNSVSIGYGSRLMSLPEGVFEACGGIKTLDLAALTECTEIGSWALAECGGLEVLVLPENLTSLGESSLHATSVVTIELPAFLEYIGTNGMGSMTSLQTINAVELAQVPQLGISVWNNVDQPKVTLVAPDDMVSAYEDANQWKEFAIIPQSTWESSTEQVRNELTPNTLVIQHQGDRLKVSANAPLGRVAVYNVGGHQVASVQSAGESVDINVSGWARGVYLVVAEAGVAKISL